MENGVTPPLASPPETEDDSPLSLIQQQPDSFFANNYDGPGPQDVERYRDSYSLLDAAGAAMGNDFITWTAVRELSRLGRGIYERDEEFDPDDDEYLRTQIEGRDLPITPQLVRNLSGAVSQAHADAILDRAQSEVRNERIISQVFENQNAEAFLFRLGTSMFDPAGWLAGSVAGRVANTGLRARQLALLNKFADEGISSVSQDLRGAAAAQAPAISRWDFAAREALAAGAADGTLEAYHVNRSATAGAEEAVLAGLGSLALSGVFGSIGYKGAMRNNVRQAQIDFHANTEREFDSQPFNAEEFDAAVDAEAGEYGFGDEAVAQESLDGVEPEAEAERANAPIPEEELRNLDQSRDIGEGATFGGSLRLDTFASLARSAISSIRGAVGLMLEDGAATMARQGRSQGFSVELLASKWEREYNTRTQRSLLDGYEEWAGERGLSLADKEFNQQAFHDYQRDVARYIRGVPGNYSPGVQRAGNEVRTALREQLQKAQEHGILSGVETDPHYLPRFWRRDAMIAYINSRPDGRERLQGLMARSIEDGLEDIKEATDRAAKAEKIANGMINIMLDKSVSQDDLIRLAAGSGDASRAELMAALGDSDPDVVEAVLDLVSTGQREKEMRGQGARSERRLKVNEATSITFDDGEKLSLDDMLNNDVASIMTIYSRQVGGRSAFSQASGGLLKNNQDFAQYFARMRWQIRHLDNKTKEQEAKRIARLEAIQGFLVGNGSVVDESSFGPNATRAAKFIRDLSFARLMGQVGFAQLSELGTAMGALGVRAFLRNAPSSIKHVLNNYQPGKSEQLDHVAGVLADLTGMGNMYFNGRVRSLSRELDADDVHGGRDSLPGRKGQDDSRAYNEENPLYRSAEIGARGVSILSGLQPITDAAQIAVLQTFVASMARNAMQGKGLLESATFRKASETRRLSLGLDEEWEGRISAMLNEVAVYENGVLTEFNAHKATDSEALDYMIMAAYRESRRIIQEGDLGTSREVMVHPLIRLLLQFRTFGINAHVKQMMYGLSVADARAGTEFLMSSVMAGIGQMAKYNMMTLGMSQDRREEYLDYAFGKTPEERLFHAVTAGIRMSSHVGLLPDAIDTLTQLFLQDRYFDFRNTNLSSDMLDPESSAAWNTITAPAKPIASLIQGEPRDATRHATSLFPNLLPIKVLGNFLQEQVPESFDEPTDQ